ncbi:response regulator [Bacillus sp. WMMC1349]|uniref:response regulator transcription factor n=1 Tax=Bacillus sp. WMMC1349 TaxID=2736254 RepID=UPI0015579D23|nr:response regulator [Bacillus sp. WMMC1349]NPC91504.1 response regulator [Bacillus sp. WMMC1349]
MNEYWRVVIADDEPWIREGIRDAVLWKKFQMEVSAEAEDGEEAFGLAIKHSIHIMIVDLNMPIMNGLELMKKVRKKLPECRFIVVTGYDWFSYAQEAIRLHVDDYLLKPIEPQQLEAVLEKIRQSLLSEQQKERHLQKNLGLLKEHFFLKWINGQVSENDVEQQLKFLHLPTSHPGMLCVIRSLKLDEVDRVKEVTEQFFVEETKKAVFLNDERLVIICLWRIFTNHEQQMFVDRLNVEIKAGTSVVFMNLTEARQPIAQAYQTCKQKLSQTFNISPIVVRAKAYMHKHFDSREISLKQVADTLQVSSVYLSRMMKQELGMTFVQLLTEMRMQKAVYLLKTTTLPIHVIAEQTGYETQHYFSTVFKKTIGASPNQYRHKM